MSGTEFFRPAKHLFHFIAVLKTVGAREKLSALFTYSISQEDIH